ncbi:CARDB domain-containing protein [uncultured Hymenobacter sp.]|uniref:CARDB domain-containing protein n=1 Tax=uncultured Hymenobacter sp. TaxID=170016 RepID=UPI0035CAC38B
MALPAIAQTYQLPTSGSTAFTTCGGTLYDDGGANGNYSANADGSLTLTPATAGNKIRLQFTSFNVETGYDRLYIYDGSSTTAPLIGTFDSQTPDVVYATNSAGTLTIRFTADHIVHYSGFAANIACVTTVPQADLAIQGASAQPLAIIPGNSLAVNCTVYNLSGAVAQSSNVGYYLSTDATLSSNDVLLGNSIGSSLGVNQSSYRSATLPIPASTSSGSYYLLFAADYLNVVSESNESNNIATISVNVVPPTFDLVIQQANVSTPNTAPGNVLTFSCSIVNQGNATAAFSSVGYYLSTDPALDINDQLLASSFGNQLTPGFGQYRSVSTNVPPGTTPGSYYVLFAADYQNVVTESIETNNVAAVSISVSAPSMDLVVQQAQIGQTSVAPGATLNATAFAYNQGNTTAGSSSTGVYLSTDATLSSNDQLLTANSVPQLTTNQGYTTYPQFTLPGTVVPGTYYVLFVADHLNAVAETNETNNVRSQILTVVAPGIDLALLQPGLSRTSAGTGISFNAYVTINNQGNSAASSSNVGYYLSVDNALSTSDVLIGATSGGFLTANNYDYRTASLSIPTGTTPGNYYVLFVADHTALVNETNENNNTVALPFVVTAPFNGTMVPYSGTATITTCNTTIYDHGGTGNYDDGASGVLVINPGTAGSKIQLIFNSFAVETCCDRLTIYDGPTTSSPIIGSYVNDPGIITASNSTGTLTLQFSTDYSVTNTGFEAAVSCIVPAAMPDLVPLSSTSNPSSATTGSTITLVSAIRNQGSVTATSSTLSYYLSTNTTLDASDLVLGSVTGGALVPTQTAVRGGQFTIPNTVMTGSYYLLHVADPQNSVSESSETNNVTFSNLFVTSPMLPDLLIGQAALSNSAVVAGSAISANCLLSNQGNTTAAQSAIGYYLSTDAVFGSNDVFLGNSQAGLLGPSALQPMGTSLIIPANTVSGSYYVLFVADHVNNIVESNETNNVTSRSLAIGIVQGMRDEQLAGLTLSVFPNPAAVGKHFTVQLAGTSNGKTADLTLYDALGRQVSQQKLTLNSRMDPATFDTQTLSPGIYVLRLTGAGLNATRRIIVE